MFQKLVFLTGPNRVMYSCMKCSNYCCITYSSLILSKIYPHVMAQAKFWRKSLLYATRTWPILSLIIIAFKPLSASSPKAVTKSTIAEVVIVNIILNIFSNTTNYSWLTTCPPNAPLTLPHNRKKTNCQSMNCVYSGDLKNVTQIFIPVVRS